jgi:hypothetical protein
MGRGQFVFRCCLLPAVWVVATVPGWGQVANPAVARSTLGERGSDVGQKLREAVQAAQTLRTDSLDAFRRGLLPLPDHLEHLAAIFDAEGRAAWESVLRASGRGSNYEARPGYEKDTAPPIDRKLLIKAMQPVFEARIQVLRDAVARLEQFKQPAAIGWAGDVALARVALCQAQLEAARWLGDRGQVLALENEEQVLAAQHYAQRLFDERFLGVASVPTMIHAVSLLNIAPEFKRNFYESAAVETTLWNLAGAEIGRGDAVTLARLNVSWLSGYTQQADGTLVINERNWQESDQLAQRLFEQRLEWYPKGTATLADLSRSWQMRQQMHQIAREAGYEVPAASLEQHQRNLQVLVRSADAVRDLRGRAAADVRYVRVLSSLKAAEPVPGTGSARR